MTLKKSLLSRAVFTAVAGAGLLGSSVALSQQTIEITGSRLSTLGATSPSPLQVITSQDIEASGAVNVQDLLLKNPTMGSPSISRTNSNFSTASAGVATVDLRNLGNDRTLVLINGRRVVSGIPGSAAVDLNTIPTEFVERVEILTGGASSLYGSDAVAGVVNIILKKSFEGLSLDVSTGQSTYGDDKKDRFSLTYGTKSASGKARSMTQFSYSKQGEVMSASRPGGEVDNLPLAWFTGEPWDLMKVQEPFYSSYAPQGTLLNTTVGSRTFDSAGNLIPVATNSLTSPTGFNRQSKRTIALPTERMLLSSSGEVEISPAMTAFFEGTYAKTSTKTQLEPFPLAHTDIYPKKYVPAQFIVGGVTYTNPMIPSNVLSILKDNDGDGLLDYGFTKRLTEVANRGNIADRGTFRIATGVKGELPRGWEYETYVSYGSTNESQVSGGQVNVLNFRNALEAIPDVNDVDGDGNRTEGICKDPIARSQKCVPINVLGLNAISPAGAAYINAPGFLSTSVTQKVAAGIVRGEPFSLPAGKVGVAAGFEYRSEHSRSTFDALQQAGLNAGNAIPETEGGFNVREVFTETRLPLLKGAPGFNDLTASIALRGSDYSTVGKARAWTTGFEWKPSSEVRVRATRALATRAPNVSELYSPPSQTFPPGLTDPCKGVKQGDTSVLASRCLADPGILKNVQENGSFTQTQSDIQGISGFNRGNPELSAEEGKTTTIGVVYTPSKVKNTSITLDYWDVKIEDAIVGTPRQFALDQCYNGGDQYFCSFITRRTAASGNYSPGSIEFIDSADSNSGGVGTKGLDLTVVNQASLLGGALTSRLTYTRLTEGYSIPLPGADKSLWAGEIGAPKNRALLSLTYSRGPWTVNTSTTWLGRAYYDDLTLDADYGAAPETVWIGSYAVTDMQVSHAIGKHSIYLGVNNLFGRHYPQVANSGFHNSTGVPTPDQYDVLGRRWYLGAKFNF